ncbi:MAG: hypothetical protein R3C68_00665 [Myxococcota bacterium]
MTFGPRHLLLLLLSIGIWPACNDATDLPEGGSRPAFESSAIVPFDHPANQVSVLISAELKSMHISVTDSRVQTSRDGKQVFVHARFADKFEGALALGGVDAQNKELGRSTAIVNQAAQSEVDIAFRFDIRTALRAVQHYEMTLAGKLP